MGNINFKVFEYYHDKISSNNINDEFVVYPAGYVIERNENGDITKFNLTGFNLKKK